MLLEAKAFSFCMIDMDLVDTVVVVLVVDVAMKSFVVAGVIAIAKRFNRSNDGRRVLAVVAVVSLAIKLANEGVADGAGGGCTRPDDCGRSWIVCFGRDLS